MAFVEDEKYDTPPDPTRIWRYYRLTRFVQFIEGGLFMPSFATLRKDDGYEAAFTTPELRHMEEASREQAFVPPLAKQLDNVHAHNVYVSCWCESDNEGIDMWSRYVESTGEEGVAVAASVGALKDVFAALDSPMNIGRCTYDHDSAAEGHAEGHRLYFRKRAAFSHEREVRAVLLEPHLPPEGFTLPIDHDRLIQEVRLPRGASDALRDKVKGLLSSVGLSPGRVRPSELEGEPPQVPTR